MNQVVTAALKLKLEPSAEVAKILDSQSRMCNWLYNHLLENANTLRERYRENQEPNLVKTLYTKHGLRNLVPLVKKEHPFLKSVHSSPLKNVALRLTDSIQTHQKSRKGKRKGHETGWPRFRSWSEKWFSLLYDEPNKGFKLIGEQLRLSLGQNQAGKRHHVEIFIKEMERLQHKTIRNLRIVQQNKLYFAVFTVEQEVPEPKPIRKMIALDPNHKNLAYGVNSAGVALEIESPWWLKKFDKRIDELKAKRDRCKKKSIQIQVLDEHRNPIKNRWQPSRRYQHVNRALEHVYAKRREQTKVYCYTIAKQLVKTHDLVVIGDYTPNGNGITAKMRRAINNRSLIGRFKDTLSWVALKSGKLYDEFDEKGTTSTCHCCNYRVVGGLVPHIRHWICPSCNIHHIRDENAAINGMRKVLRDLHLKSGEHTLPVPGSGLVTISQRWAWRVLPRGIVAISRGQSCVANTSAKKLNRMHERILPEFACEQV